MPQSRMHRRNGSGATSAREYTLADAERVGPVCRRRERSLYPLERFGRGGRKQARKHNELGAQPSTNLVQEGAGALDRADARFRHCREDGCSALAAFAHSVCDYSSRSIGSSIPVSHPPRPASSTKPDVPAPLADAPQSNGVEEKLESLVAKAKEEAAEILPSDTGTDASTVAETVGEIGEKLDSALGNIPTSILTASQAKDS
eukprot:scaffold1233_cov395-Prasinococcus_capsulatus_cf.AAC.19